jgi:hypothetical protein
MKKVSYSYPKEISLKREVETILKSEMSRNSGVKKQKVEQLAAHLAIT